MGKRISIIDVVLTAVFCIVACCGIGMTVHNRVEKGSETTPNICRWVVRWAAEPAAAT